MQTRLHSHNSKLHKQNWAIQAVTLSRETILLQRGAQPLLIMKLTYNDTELEETAESDCGSAANYGTTPDTEEELREENYEAKRARSASQRHMTNMVAVQEGVKLQ